MAAKRDDGRRQALALARRYLDGGRVGYWDGGDVSGDVEIRRLPSEGGPLLPLRPLPDVERLERYVPSPGERAGALISDALRHRDRDLGDRLGTAARYAVDYGPIPAKVATSIIRQPVTAGEALGEALVDPTLPNITNAGAEAALTLARPALALKAIGAGAAVEAPSFIGSALAQSSGADEIADLNKRIREAQGKIEDIGKTKYRGKFEEAEASRAAARRPYQDAIDLANSRIAQIKARQDKDAADKERAGRPVRELLPPVLNKTLPLWTGLVGGLAARGAFSKWNKEYSNAIQQYRDAEAAGSAAEMAVRRNQIRHLEENTPWGDPKTWLAAGLPLEVRSMEHAVDARQPEDTAAYKDAQRRLHDPMSLATDIGGGLLSGLVGLGLGAKSASGSPERGLGRTIAQPNPYDHALTLADHYRKAHESGPFLPRSGAGSAAGELLADPRPALPAPQTAAGAGATTSGGSTLPSPERLLPAERLADRIAASRPAPPLQIEAPANPPASFSGSATSPTSAPERSVVIKTRDPRGHWQHRTPDGKYTSDPRQEAPKGPPKSAAPEDAADIEAGKGKSKPRQENGGGTEPKESTAAPKNGTSTGIESGIVTKPPKDYDPEDPINRGRKFGGVVGAIKGALATARRYADGGSVHSGPLTGSTGGRSDAIATNVHAGSFVWPADVVAGRGEGNTAAGQEFLRRLEQTAVDRCGPRVASALSAGMATGGSAGASGDVVPVALSDGERSTPPHVVAAIGGGDMKLGHDICNSLVRKFRQDDIARLKSLPPPSR